jgi:membrane fusion protein, multidrug efflux system
MLFTIYLKRLQPILQKRFMKSIFIFSIVSILIVFSSCKKEINEVKSTSKISALTSTIVKTALIGDQSDEGPILQQGIVMSKSEAKPSFKTGGVIARTYVSEGQMVRKGQLLATLKMDEINAQVRQAEEGFSKSERDMTRARNLFADSVATLEQVQNATTAFEFAKRTVEIAKFNRQYSQVLSPISGKVVKQLMHAGEIVGPGMPIYGIIGTSSQDWIVRAGLVDRDWARAHVGDNVDLTFDAYPGQNYKGKISEKSVVTAGNSGVFDVEIRMSKQPTNLAAGLISKVTIYPTKKLAFRTIPIESLVGISGQVGRAFTIVDGKAKTLNLTIAKILGERVAISQGLEGVTELITTGAMFLEEGDPVVKQ